MDSALVGKTKIEIISACNKRIAILAKEEKQNSPLDNKTSHCTVKQPAQFSLSIMPFANTTDFHQRSLCRCKILRFIKCMVKPVGFIYQKA
jgi:hypothetical protein